MALGFKNIRSSKYQEHSEYISGAIEYQNIFSKPTSVRHWQSKFPSIKLSWVYSNTFTSDVFASWYSLFEWSTREEQFIYSRQTFLIYKSDNDTDLQCDTSLESLEHLFVKCDEVQGSHILQIDILRNCLVNGMSANIVMHDYTQLILFNGQKRKRKKKKRIFLLISIG